MSSLNVIALISGGKDSLFSILHCQANGHTIVALANLYPSPSTSEDGDINSYMYQTVGHAVIPLYEEALEIPLYRQEITGKAVNANRDYESLPPLAGQEKDETEDLVPLLKKVMHAHPEANAVSTGAILSTYQRTRVESVALRLGLTPLSYLWQYPLLPPYTQTSLLYDMAAVGQEAVIIKTASGGLDEGFLGLDVAQQRTIMRLGKAMGRFGEGSNGAILGEGGEFETLALDGPKSLWKKRIRIEAASPGVLEGGQTVFRIKSSALEEKSGDGEEHLAPLRVPELFDDEFKKVLELVEKGSDDNSSLTEDSTCLDKLVETNLSETDMSTSEPFPENVPSDTGTVFTYSNLASPSQPQSHCSRTSPSRQLTKILLRLEHVLTQQHLSKSGINHCTLLLRNMADFSILNPIYGQYFSDTNPPARVTIAVGDAMPKDVDVMLSVIVDRCDDTDRNGKIANKTKRQGLHVQGRSYWAPANIGPYSQAISVPLPRVEKEGGEEEKEEEENTETNAIVYVAGQIPLVPASMQVYNEQGFKGQVALSLQHLWRIGRAKGVRWWTAGVGFIPACENAEARVRTAQQVWKRLHSPACTSPSSTNGNEDEDENEESHIDPWDRLNRTTTSLFNDTTFRPPIPHPSTTCPPPPCFIAQVDSLPRAVDIEWSATGLTSATISLSHSHPRSPISDPSPSPSPSPFLTRTAISGSRSRFYTLEISQASDMEVFQRSGEQHGDWAGATLYTGRGFVGKWARESALRGVQWVPCRRVWGGEGRELRAVLVGRVDGAV